jgi:hypothetical protein
MRSFVPSVRARGTTLALALVAACSPSSLVDVQAPGNVVDPSQVKTAATAIGFYYSAVAWFDKPLAGTGLNTSVISAVGLFTDELAETTAFTSGGLDERLLSLPAGASSSTALYTNLHQARIQAQQARQALQLYAPNAPKAWQGQLYALEAYTVLYFAENFCSGIPLTAVPIDGTPQPTAGLTTEALYNQAITLFDSAIVAGADSAQFVNLAMVGKGRALLGLGRFADAMAAVHSVQTNFLYLAQFSTQIPNTLSNQTATYRAQNAEGGNGLVWSADPRTGIVIRAAIAGAMLWPAKYYVTAAGTLDASVVAPNTPVRVADGLEARLIEAEADLASGGANWLTILNSLRATCIGQTPCAPVPGLTSASLPPLTDPGTATARLNLVMKERAMWLYLTGHREADLRRMARLYQRDPATLWPTGRISAPAFPPLYITALASDGTLYGTDLVFLPSPNEKTNNSLFGGCYDFDP